MGGWLKRFNILFILICSIFCALITCINFIKRPTNALWFYGCNFENKNTGINKICLDHSKV